MCADTTRYRISSAQPRCKAVPGRRRRNSRHGLAPLEMVLGLPVLLMLFALMVNAGFTGVWKLRLLGASREVAWRSREPRTNNLPDPAYQKTFWTQPDHPSETPLTAATHETAPLKIDDLGSYSGVRADIGTLSVDKNLLDPKRGVYEGTSNVARQLPLLPERLQPVRGSPSHQLTDNSFPFWKTHLASNVGRRTKILYGEWFNNPSFTSADTAFANPPAGSNRGIGQIEYGSDWQNFDSAATVAHDSIAGANLRPLESFKPDGIDKYRDPEVDVWAYSIGGRSFEPRPPQFMPTIGYFINSDTNAVRDQYVTPTIEKIDDDPNALGSDSENEGNLPYTLADRYINFFEECINLPVNSVEHLYKNAADDPSYQIDMNAAEEEKTRREAILDPVIQQLKSYQNQF